MTFWYDNWSDTWKPSDVEQREWTASKYVRADSLPARTIRAHMRAAERHRRQGRHEVARDHEIAAGIISATKE